MYWQSAKNLLNGNISSICPHDMLNFGQLTAEICWWVCGTPADLTSFASWLHYCTDVAHRRRSMDVNQTLHDVWLSPALVYYLYIFGGSCPLTQFSQLQTSLCIQVFQSPILAALSVLHGTRAVGVSQSLWRGTRIGSTELSQMAAPIFGRAAITLSIDPHCSYIILTSCVN